MGGKIQIDVPMDKIEAFCKKWKLVEFSLFGSVVRDDFRPDSDVDVLVTFDEKSEWSLFDIVAMQYELHDIFGRGIDIVEEDAIRSPYRKEYILLEKTVIYGNAS